MDEMRLRTSSKRPGLQPGCQDDKTTACLNDSLSRTFTRNIRRLRNWISHSLDDKPYDVRESFGNTLWTLSKRLLTAGILARYIVHLQPGLQANAEACKSALIFGAVGMSFNIANHKLWETYQINQDAQLAAFGVLNTILAYMVRDSLKHISDTFITKWIVADDGCGATVLDFEMGEELTKPWAAISKFHTRRKQHGWNVRHTLRFILAFTTGTCLLLQGAGMNTVGMPKRRWWPDASASNPSDDRFYFTNKTMRVENVSQMSVWGRSWNMIREGGDVSWELVRNYSALRVRRADLCNSGPRFCGGFQPRVS